MQAKRHSSRAGSSLSVMTSAGRYAKALSSDLQAAARRLRLKLHALNADTERDFDTVFAKLVDMHAGGLVIGTERCHTLAVRSR
jgi:hypothetical protein